MESDPHTPDGEDRGDDATPPAQVGPAAGDSPRTGQEGTSPAADAPAHDYSYGEDPLEPAGTGGPRAADSGTGAAGTGTGSADPAPAEDHPDAATGLHAAAPPGSTALRGGTAPRAVLRPVPEGFPTPPPRPARPNRRPAPKPDPSAPSRSRSPLLIAGLAAVAVLLLVVVIGGGILAVRSFAPGDDAPAAGDPTTSADPASTSPGPVEIAGATFTEVSTEVGVRAVGSQSSRIEPEGEFVIVTYEVDNPTDQTVQVGSNLTLEAADGSYRVDPEATREHQADSSGYGVVPAEATATFHAVFDVPIGTDPTGLTLELPGGSGTLPLDG